MSASLPIHRHRTAMARHTLSQPMSLMVQHSLIKLGVSVFDYGCGQGDDLRALAAAGVEASGWDPYFAAGNPRLEADVVNLGFVLNVIENEAERHEALLGAWNLARTVLAVSTMIMGQVPTGGLASYRDGFLTSRATFQKYFTNSELRELIADTTDADPVAAAPGIFLAFRRSEDQEEFLLRRRMSRRISTAGYRVFRAKRQAEAKPGLEERIAPATVVLADLARLRGRLPAVEEVPAATLDLLAKERVSVQRALDVALAQHLSREEFDQAAAGMREDLLVHYALARLNQSRTVDRPSASMVRDIRAHFGNHRELLASATNYLMGLGDDAAISNAAAQAVKQEVGAIDHRGRLLFDARQRESLPGLLRVYLGCAAYLAGEPTDESLVRIDSALRLVSYLPIKDRLVPFPIMSEVTTIDLQRQSVRTLPIRRMLLAKSMVLTERTNMQRQREKELRRERGLDNSALLVRIE